jgi:hypothetical protein
MKAKFFGGAFDGLTFTYPNVVTDFDYLVATWSPEYGHRIYALCGVVGGVAQYFLKKEG